MRTRKSRLIPLLKAGVWIASLVPVGLLANDFLSGAYLLADPVEMIQKRTGISILIFLLLTLSVTPLRRATGWNRLIRFRRLLGLFAFFYAVMHAFSYFVFDQRLSLSGILKDVSEHPWVLVGFTAFVLLIPLAVTSTTGWIRRMGGTSWTRLHMLIYPIAVLGVLHFLWLVKADLTEPVIYGAVLVVLLAVRARIGWSDRKGRSGSGVSGQALSALKPPASPRKAPSEQG